MKILKFGGASVKDVTAIQNMANILAKEDPAQPLVMVVSALGKTTNALEKVVNAYISREEDPFLLLAEIKQSHYVIAQELMPHNQNKHGRCSWFQKLWKNSGRGV